MASSSPPFTNTTTLATPSDMARSSDVDIQHIILYLTLSFFSVLGVVGNAIAFYIFFKRRNSSTSVIFILALAGTDFVTCLVTVPFTMVFEALHYRMYYDGLCKLYMFFVTSTIPFSSLIMTGIAVDRYFCICHPFLHVLNVQRARLAVLCLALPAFTFGVITAMSYGLFLVQDSLLLNGTFLLGTNLTREEVQPPALFLNVSDVPGAVPPGHMIDTDVVVVGGTGNASGGSGVVVPVRGYRQLVQNAECIRNTFYFSEQFQTWYHYTYTSCYLMCFVIVMALYVLIYKSILSRRAMKAKRRKKNYYTSVANTDNAHAPPRGNTAAPPDPKNRTQAEGDTVLSELNGNNAGDAGRVPKRRGSANRDRNLYANIKTAMMLFVVTLVFIVAFAPSCFIAHGIIPMQLNVFYMYFAYNVANPFIYAFMNQSFREDLKKLLKRS
ncbi:uncharacterized protein LOC143287158 [Babylonia areolata]|uniref:uncharacterized protein LOC143287158 n=1 Tax=Babylonia areolata TaxID=304850 RepID=UPI003FD171CA